MNLNSGPLEGVPKEINSKEALFARQYAKQFASRYIEKGKLSEEVLGNEEKIKEAIAGSGIIKDINVSPVEVLDFLWDMGVVKKNEVIAPEVAEKKSKIQKKSEFIPIKIKEQKLQIIDNPELTGAFFKNQKIEAVKKEKKEVFDNDEELEKIYTDTLALEKSRTLEDDDYYLNFAHLVKGGEEEIKRDLNLLKEREDSYEINKAKKIATVAEVALEYGVSELGWYGDKVKITPASRFDDIKRRVDDILEIVKDNQESQFLGLGIDVTFRGLHSEQYKEKIFTLLKSIKDGYKTKVKYFTTSEGKKMKEFAVPKVILYFNFGDVKSLAYLLKNIQDPKNQEDFKNHSLRFEIMNQIITQCEILAKFAKKYHNGIHNGYTATLESIKDLARENKEIQTMLDIRHEDKTSRHLNKLIEEFEQQEEAQKEPELTSNQETL